MWHWGIPVYIVTTFFGSYSDPSLWNENNKGNRRMLTCRECGCYWSICSEEDGKWDIFNLHIHHYSIFTTKLMTSNSSLLCSWKPALWHCWKEDKMGRNCLVGLMDTSFLWRFFPPIAEFLDMLLWKVVSIFLWI